MEQTAVIHGRFQVVHYDHMKYLSAGRAHCRHLVIGITNPDPTTIRDDPADPGRSQPQSNLLTYYERHCLLHAACLEQAWGTETFSIVPFPVNQPALYQYYVPMDATFLLTIYDDWGEKKLELFKSLGLKTHVMWKKPLSEKGMTSTEVRRRIAAGEHWDHMVPSAAAKLMKKMGMVDKIKKASG